MTNFARAARLRATLLAALALAAVPQAALARKDIGETAAAALPQAQTYMATDNCEGALRQVSPVVADKAFATLEDRVRVPFLMIATLCEARGDRIEPALLHAREMTAITGAPGVAWSLRFGLELDGGRPADAVATLETMQKDLPDGIDPIQTDWLMALGRKFAGDQANPAYRRYLALLSASPRAQDDPRFEGIRRAYARVLKDSGDDAGASAQIAAIGNARLLRDISLDPALRSLLPETFDLRAAYQREIADLERRSILRPGLLTLPIQLATAQRAIGEADKARVTLEAARPYGVLEKQFSDRDSQLNWWWDGLARTYEQLGRYEDGVAAYRQAIASGESGRVNVSQTINLAYLQSRFGHHDAALETLAPLGATIDTSASPYGTMEYRLAHGCAAQGAGQTDLAEADLAYAEAHAEDHAEAVTDLQICLNRVDAAAASMIARLGDPDRRVDALAQLSDYAPPPANLPPMPFAAGLAALKQRADVQAAVARAGGTRKFDVQVSGL
jgi:tetratricopeptide (TPR) repeat protein